MQPEIVTAADYFESSGLLPPERAALLRRVARRELAGIRVEIRLLLYLGILLLTTGAGLFVHDYYDRIGPAGLALLLSAGTAACFWRVWRQAPPFTWSQTTPRLIATDYLLLLGILLLALDLATIETGFGLLGGRWPHYLLAVALVDGWAAYRFDSRSVLSLAITALAGWLGINLQPAGFAEMFSLPASLILPLLLLGGLCRLLGWLSEHRDRKAHFAGTWSVYGLLFFFLGCLTGAIRGSRYTLAAWGLLLLAAGAAETWLAWRKRRPLFFCLGTAAAYAGFIMLNVAILPGVLFQAGCLFIIIGGVAALILIFLASRKMKEGRS